MAVTRRTVSAAVESALATSPTGGRRDMFYSLVGIIWNRRDGECSDCSASVIVRRLPQLSDRESE